VGVTADVYALGATLYKLLTGRPPFRGPDAESTLQQVRTEEPVRPSRLNPRVPRALELVCLKCLRKEPARHYASAQELADDLGRFLAGEPVWARPVPPWVRARAWARKRPASALAALAVPLLAGVLFAGLAWRAAELQRHADDLLAARNQADARRVEAEAKEAEARRRRAASEMRLAGQLLRTGDVPGMAGLLDRQAPDDRRRFEWRYLDRQRWTPFPSRQASPASPVLLAFGGDARTLVTAANGPEQGRTAWCASGARTPARTPSAGRSGAPRTPTA
jgi:hypothetical protein